LEDKNMDRLNGHDVRHLAHELAEKLWNGEGYEDDGPEVVMTSVGYVDLYSDGSVGGYGRILWELDPDSCGTWCPICGTAEDDGTHDICEEMEADDIYE
jgi:hypothetical protein